MDGWLWKQDSHRQLQKFTGVETRDGVHPPSVFVPPGPPLLYPERQWPPPRRAAKRSELTSGEALGQDLWGSLLPRPLPRGASSRVGTAGAVGGDRQDGGGSGGRQRGRPREEAPEAFGRVGLSPPASA